MAQARYLTLENESEDIFPVILTFIIAFYAIKLIRDCCGP